MTLPEAGSRENRGKGSLHLTGLFSHSSCHTGATIANGPSLMSEEAAQLVLVTRNE